MDSHTGCLFRLKWATLCCSNLWVPLSQEARNREFSTKATGEIAISVGLVKLSRNALHWGLWSIEVMAAVQTMTFSQLRMRSHTGARRRKSENFQLKVTRPTMHGLGGTVGDRGRYLAGFYRFRMKMRLRSPQRLSLLLPSYSKG